MAGRPGAARHFRTGLHPTKGLKPVGRTVIRVSRQLLEVEARPVALERDGHHGMGPDGLDRAADLPEVTPEVAPYVVGVVGDHAPEQFAHGKLRGELEGSFARVLLGNEPLEGVGADKEANFVDRLRPKRIDARGHALVVGLHGNLRFNQHRLAIAVEIGEAQRLAVHAECESAVRTFPAVAGERRFAGLVLACGKVAVIGADFRLVAEDIDDVLASDEFQERLTLVALESLHQQVFAHELAREFKKIEVQAGIGSADGGGEQGVYRLGIARKHVLESVGIAACAARHDELAARLRVEDAAVVGVHHLDHLLFQRILGGGVGALERGSGLLDVDQRTHAAEGLERVAVRGRADIHALADFSGNREIGLEHGSAKGDIRHRPFLHDASHGIGDVGQRAALHDVCVGSLSRQTLHDIADDAIGVLGAEVLDCGRIEDRIVAGEARNADGVITPHLAKCGPVGGGL